jgi:hypothetical protein
LKNGDIILIIGEDGVMESVKRFLEEDWYLENYG